MCGKRKSGMSLCDNAQLKQLNNSRGGPFSWICDKDGSWPVSEAGALPGCARLYRIKRALCTMQERTPVRGGGRGGVVAGWLSNGRCK